MLEFLIDDCLIEKNDKIAVGVSGGADSMVLLWALIDKQKQTGFDLHVVNVNHHLRGNESDSDSAFVEEFCKKRKISYTIVDVDVKSLKLSNKLTIEEAARIARYEAFEKVMKQHGLNKLALAHHKNDQAETILMHIFRGAGIAGATGIKQTEKTIRPLLNLTKEEILKIAVEHGVKFVNDSSNADNAYSRNYVRNVIIPTIEKLYPGVVNSICEFGKKCNDVQKFIENQIKIENIEENKDYILLKEQVFEEDKLLVYCYIKKVFEKFKVFSDIETKHYALIEELHETDVNKSIDLPHQMVAKKTYSGLKFFKKTKAEKLERESIFCIGECSIEGFGKIKTSLISADEVVYGEGVLFVDYAKISNDAVWRFRKLGDQFSKLGTGSKKLNDYFTDKKIDFELRDNLPVLARGSQVLVVAENDISEYVKIDGTTDQIVKIEFFRI